MAKIYQIRIDIEGAKPPIWRRILVNDSTTLFEFHIILQMVMGWENAHLYQFDIGTKLFGNIEWNDDGDINDDKLVCLNELFKDPLDKEFMYIYDFGDNWEHNIKIEKVLNENPKQQYPFCVTGRRACPPEDCGGIWGYEDLLVAYKDPKDENHSLALDCFGDDFDPNDFDLDKINKQFAIFEELLDDEDEESEGGWMADEEGEGAH